MSTLDSQTLVDYKSGLTPKSKNLRCGPQVNTYNSRMGLFETQHHMGLSENSVPPNPLMFFSSIPHFQRHPSMTQHLHQISSNIINSSLNPYINIHIFVGEILIAGAFGIQRIGQAQLMQPLGILGGVYRARVLESAGDLVTLKLLGGKDLELLIPSSKLT